MQTLLDVFEDVLYDEQDFNRAKIASERLLNCFQGEHFSVILAALYLTAMTVMDCVEMKCRSSNLYN